MQNMDTTKASFTTASSHLHYNLKNGKTLKFSSFWLTLKQVFTKTCTVFFQKLDDIVTKFCPGVDGLGRCRLKQK